MTKFVHPGSLSNIRDYQLFKDYALHNAHYTRNKDKTSIRHAREKVKEKRKRERISKREKESER